MKFINEGNLTSKNESSDKQLSKREQHSLIIEDFLFSIYFENVQSQFESEDDDLALFGVGGPA